MSKITFQNLNNLKKRFNIKDKIKKNDSIIDLDCEDPSEYCIGGYCPVKLLNYYGEKNRYIVVDKLGWGSFSTVWLAYDYNDATFVALKFQKANENCRDAAMDEIKIHNILQNASAIVKLKDHFFTFSDNGKHATMVFELLGDNIFTLLRSREYKGLPIGQVKLIAKDLLMGLQQAHNVNIIHTDIKPENILIIQPSIKLSSQINKWKPPPRDGIPLIERTDISLLSKSQQRRLKKKLKQEEIKNSQPIIQEKVNKKENFINYSFSFGGDISPIKDTNDSNANINLVDINLNQKELITSNSKFNSNNKQLEVIVDPLENSNQNNEIKFISLQNNHPIKDNYDHFPLHVVKIADFGNGCWKDLHTTEDIQTCQYKSPETIIQSGYNELADIWSAACVIFELLTGDFLFQPKASKKNIYTRDEDHLALMIELLGDFSLDFLKLGKKSSKYFDSKGNLKHIKKFNRTSIYEILITKYNFNKNNAQEIQSFLLPMLAFDPKKRSNAKEMLSHKWLEDADKSLDEEFNNNFAQWYQKLQSSKTKDA